MSGQHTPGPWYAHNLSLGPDGDGPYTWPLGTDPDEAAANARLIAQAPAMLAALRDLSERATYDPDAGVWTMRSPVDGVISEVRALLRAVEAP